LFHVGQVRGTRARFITARFCSDRCGHAARALDAIMHLLDRRGPRETFAREKFADRLLEAWRSGVGPDPLLVLQAVELA